MLKVGMLMINQRLKMVFGCSFKVTIHTRKEEVSWDDKISKSKTTKEDVWNDAKLLHLSNLA